MTAATCGARAKSKNVRFLHPLLIVQGGGQLTTRHQGAASLTGSTRTAIPRDGQAAWSTRAQAPLR
jgi:hypothetical protein